MTRTRTFNPHRLLAFKIKYPENFFILRGNHECASINRIYGFYDECKRRYNIKMWKTFTDCFNCLPVAAIVDEKIFCCHGGLSPELQQLDQIKKIVRPTDVPDTGLLCDLLWSDPDKDMVGWGENDRGVSFTFGEDIVAQFLRKMDLDLVCRAHQVVEDDEFFARRQLVTIFSAPNYCGEFDNAGGMMAVDETLMCSFQIQSRQKKRSARRCGRRAAAGDAAGAQGALSSPPNNTRPARVDGWGGISWRSAARYHLPRAMGCAVCQWRSRFRRDGRQSLAIVGVRFVRRGDGVGGSASCAVDDHHWGLHLRASRRWRVKGGATSRTASTREEAWKAGQGGCGCWVVRRVTGFEQKHGRRRARPTQARARPLEEEKPAAARRRIGKTAGGACRSWTTGTTRLCTTQSSSHARFTTGAPLAGASPAQTSASTCVAASGATTVAP